MNRRCFLQQLGLAGAGAAVCVNDTCKHAAQPTGEQPAKRPPNIVFLLADDLGWRELGCYGNTFNETPNLDKLAGQGMRFTDAYAAAPVCSPFRAALMSGQWPARVGITDYLRPNDEKYLSPEHVVFPELLAKAGYATGLIGKWHLTGYVKNEGAPKLHGFQEVIVSESSGIGGGDYRAPYRHAKHVKTFKEGEYLTDRVADEAVGFITRHADPSKGSGQAKPFFLFVSHYSVHTRLDGKKDLVAKYEAKAGAGKGNSARRNNPHLAAMLESIDACAGRVMATLDKLHLADNTVLVFTSDNGGEDRVTSNAPLRAGKSTLYEGGIREPLIVRYPGRVQAGSVCGTPMSTVDFYPTFLDLAGVKPDAKQKLDGVSLAPLLTGKAAPKRDSLYWHYPLARPHFLGGRSGGAIRRGDYKLIEFFDTGEVELYDLRKDLSETKDLAAAMPDKVAELRKALAVWRKDVGATMPAPAPPATGVQLHLTFDEPAGATRAVDRGPAKRKLTYHGTKPAAGRSGKPNSARSFSGKGDHLALDRRSAPEPAGKAIHVDAWVQCEGDGDGVILAHGGDRRGYVLHVTGGKAAFSVAVDWKRTTAVAPEPLGKGWKHVEGLLGAGGLVTLRVDSKEVARAKATGLLDSNPGDSLQIGADTIKPVGTYDAGNCFAGLIDEVRLVYTRPSKPARRKAKGKVKNGAKSG